MSTLTLQNLPQFDAHINPAEFGKFDKYEFMQRVERLNVFFSQLRNALINKGIITDQDSLEEIVNKVIHTI